MINNKYSISKQDVPKFAKTLLKNLKSYKIILLNGEIGVGKTFLTKEIGKQLGEKNNISSPSFQVMNIYEKFVHIDAYNLKGGLDEYYDFFEDKIVIIEWAENVQLNINNCIEINIKYLNETQRLYEVREVK